MQELSWASLATQRRYFQHAQRAAETFNSFLLHKNFKQRLWTDSPYETRQLPGIGAITSGARAAGPARSLHGSSGGFI